MDKEAIEKEIAKRKEEMIESGDSAWAIELFGDGAKFVLKLIYEVKK